MLQQARHLLSYGNEQKTAGAQTQSGWDSRLRGRGLKTPGPDFASFLPTGNQGAAAMPGAMPGAMSGAMPGMGGQQPNPQETVSNSVLGSPFSAMGANLSSVAASKQVSASPVLNSKALVSGDAVNRSNAAIRMSAERNTLPNSEVPGIISSRQTARTRSQSAMLNQDTAPGSAARRGERISGRPVTGRNDIGMVDTRKTGAPPTNVSSRLSGVRSADSGTGAKAYGLKDLSEFTAPNLMQGIGGLNGPAGITGVSTVALPNGGKNTIYVNLNDSAMLNNAMAVSRNPLKTEAANRNIEFMGGESGAAMSVKVSSHKGAAFNQSPLIQNWGSSAMSRTLNQFDKMQGEIGALAAKFESGSEGAAAIGYDRHGGTSYGKYQLSSRAGTLSKFIDYLGEKAPDLAQKLASAGPANTGRRSGKMPEVWRSIAASEPERFEQLQSDFIMKSHFQPALQGIAEKTGLEFDKMPTALQEVLFSTAVQHGPTGATRIFSRAVDRVGSKIAQLADTTADGFKKAGEALIKQVYAIREGQFVSSTAQVQQAAKNRLRIEMKEALNMLS